MEGLKNINSVMSQKIKIHLSAKSYHKEAVRFYILYTDSLVTSSRLCSMKSAAITEDDVDDYQSHIHIILSYVYDHSSNPVLNNLLS